MAVYTTWPAPLFSLPRQARERTAEADEITLLDAFQGGLVRITLTGLDEGARGQLTLERRLAMPLSILVPKGSTALGGGVEITAERELRANLRAASQVSLMFPQASSSRIVKGSRTLEACYNPSTGLLLRRLQAGREALLQAVIAQLGEAESYKRALGAGALGEAEDTRGIPHLQRLVAGDPDEHVREAARVAIARIPPAPR